AAYKRLKREPEWVPLSPADDLPKEIIDRFDAWDAKCARELKLEPLGRLVERYVDGEKIGARTVVISSDRTIVATLACSHVRPEISSRSFASIVANRFLWATDARMASSKPAHFVIEFFPKSASESHMLDRLLALHRTVEGRPKRFEDLQDYAAFQRQVWRDSH